jgi:hypothetical protein
MTIPRFALRDKATHWPLKRYIYMVKNSARIIFFIRIVVSITYCVKFVFWVVFILCTICCQFLFIVLYWLHLRYSLSIIIPSPTKLQRLSLDSPYETRQHIDHWNDIYIWLKTVQELYFSSDNLLFSLWYSNSNLWYTTTPIV